MTVTPRCKNLFQNYQDFCQFLFHCQQISEARNHPQVVSVSQRIAPVDPLSFLQYFSRDNEPYFYFEKKEFNQGKKTRQQGGAIAGFGAAVSLKTQGCDRFQQAKKFIQTTLKHTILAGSFQNLFSGPHFFCSFAFFDQCDEPLTGFPAATVFLPDWQISTDQTGCTVVANLILQSDMDLEKISQKIWQQLQQIQSISQPLWSPEVDQVNGLRYREITSSGQFQRSVQAILQAIQTQTFHKVVLAHGVEISASQPFQPIHCLSQLQHRYPDCHLFCFSNGQGQQFLGASPERLLSLRAGEGNLSSRQMITDALAGSSPRGKTPCEDAHLASSLLNNHKELHEHQLVIDFILGQLRHLNLSPNCAPLRLLQLSNIQHLQTPIQATVPADIHLLDLVAALHPTPAVAGLPRSIACEQIRQAEPFERSLYAAPIGWIDHRGQGEFAVGIRSALIDGDRARLYAGAGIVAGSDPERELAEVQLKLQALLQSLV